MTSPTVGRIVYFTPAQGDAIVRNGTQPLAAVVSCVWSDSCVNLAVFDANGITTNRTSVPLVQGDMPKPGGYFCEWMPYQIAQAAKAAAAQSE